MPAGHVPQPGQQHDVLQGQLRVGQGDRQAPRACGGPRRDGPARVATAAPSSTGWVASHQCSRSHVGQPTGLRVLPVRETGDAYALITGPDPSASPLARPGRCPARSRRAPRRRVDLAARAARRAGCLAVGRGRGRRPAAPGAPAGSRAARRPSAPAARRRRSGCAWWPGGRRSGPRRRRCSSRSPRAVGWRRVPGSWVSITTRLPASRAVPDDPGQQVRTRRPVEQRAGARSRLSTCCPRPREAAGDVAILAISRSGSRLQGDHQGVGVRRQHRVRRCRDRARRRPAPGPAGDGSPAGCGDGAGAAAAAPARRPRCGTRARRTGRSGR